MSFQRIAVIVVVAMAVICMTFNLPSLNTGDTPEPGPETPEPTAPVEPTAAGSAEPPVEPEEAAEPPVEPGAAEPLVPDIHAHRGGKVLLASGNSCDDIQCQVWLNTCSVCAFLTVVDCSIFHLRGFG
jgi:hypothetical protein